MRILRNLLYLVAIVVGIVLASANMTLVRFVYLPTMGFLLPQQAAEAEVPLALLMLASLLAGAFVAGTGTFVEHVRLRFLVRRNAKVVKGIRAELDKTKSELNEAKANLETSASNLVAEQARTRRAEESETAALAAVEQERQRADEAERQLTPLVD